MPFCPSCQSEYLDEVEVCKSCGDIPLVENLQFNGMEADIQPGEDTAAIHIVTGESEDSLIEIDGEEIDRTETIPAHVWRAMKRLNLLALKIPTEYGGAGLSQQNYMRVLAVIARYCGSVAATLSAHQSIGVPQPIKLAGTKEQKEKWLLAQNGHH